MSGDWIKVERGTPDKPEIWQIADILDIDPDAAFGKVYRVWAWFDEHTEDGNAPSVTKRLLNRLVGVTEFCDAMLQTGWMLESDGVISLKSFDKHNGTTGKKRANTARRVAQHRENKGKTEGNARDVTESVTREEKRREDNNKDKNKTKSPSALEKRFDRFWEKYPKKRSKGQAEKTWSKIKPDEQLTEQMILAVERAKTSVDWTKDGGTFIPNASTWLNNKGWLDELSYTNAQQTQSGGYQQRPASNGGFGRTGEDMFDDDDMHEINELYANAESEGERAG